MKSLYLEFVELSSDEASLLSAVSVLSLLSVEADESDVESEEPQPAKVPATSTALIKTLITFFFIS